MLGWPESWKPKWTFWLTQNICVYKVHLRLKNKKELKIKEQKEYTRQILPRGSATQISDKADLQARHTSGDRRLLHMTDNVMHEEDTASLNCVTNNTAPNI